MTTKDLGMAPSVNESGVRLIDLGFYQVDSGEAVTVPAKRMSLIHNRAVIDGKLIVDGRVGSL